MNICIKDLFIRNLFSFKGRASRKEYIVKLIIIVIIFFILQLNLEYIDEKDSWVLIILSCISVLLAYISIFQYFPLAIRRLHDLNSSGWFVLISFVPFGQLLILWLMFKKGTDGVNDYGEPPDY
jgi:uncharacterized membrane protein YhaH (DUF805 family)